MSFRTSRTLQTLVAAAVAGALCWAGLTFEPHRGSRLVWPTVTGGGFPKTVRNADGSEAELRSPPRRVVLASTTLVDFAATLLPRAHVAAMCAQALTASTLARDPTWGEGVPVYERFTTETVLAFAPDLVLCNGYNEPQTAAALLRAGVPVMVLPGPGSLADCERTVLLLGEVLDTQAEADVQVAAMERRAAALRDRAARGERRRGLCFTYNPTGSWTGGTGTLHDEALRLAGLSNAAAEAGIRDHAQVSVEQVLAMDPDVLVVDAPLRQGRGTLQFLRESGSLRDLRALRAGHVVELPQALYATGSHLVLDAAEAIAAAVDGFSDPSGR